jgi:hypothetical protein
MLVFIDESGHPHPNDPNKRPVVVAVCFSERDSRLISGRIHALKRDLLNSERIELKGVKLLNRRTYRVKRDYWGFLEEFYGSLLNLPIIVFAIIMEAPFNSGEKEDEFLPSRFRYLIQRIELLAESRGEMATIMFDGAPNLYGGLGWKFNSFLYRHDEGRAHVHITDAPAFVDSETSAGIQVADMIASVIRQYEEAELFRNAPTPGDLYLLAIRRWFRIIEQLTRNDLKSHDGYERQGFFRMRVGEK